MSTNPRPYQKNFYLTSARVRDQESRRLKADKIRYLLTQFGKVDLSSAIALDIGCSSGLITNHLSSLFYKIVGVEYDRNALNKVEKIGDTPPEYLQGDAMALPITSSSIDVIICAQTYEHVPDDTKMFDEMYRVLKPGGIVFFSGPNWLFPIEPHYFLPFLHWLPQNIADTYLKIFKHENRYFEKSRTLWSLKKQLKMFSIEDYTLYIFLAHKRSIITTKFHQIIVNLLSYIVLPFVPNFNFLLRKPIHGKNQANS